jgi:small subunit ribosomal protein S5
MTEEATNAKQTSAPAQTNASSGPQQRGGGRSDVRSFRLRQRGPGGGRGRFGGRGRRDPKTDIPEQSDYEEKSLEIARITRVTAGGKRMRFRALGIVGNRKGRVGFGLGKATDVAGATSKAFAQARKNLITIPLKNETIPHEVTSKYCSAVVLLKPAPKGTGVKAGGAVRQVLDLAGVPNVVSKIMGSSNKTNNVKATFNALKSLRMPPKAKKEGEEQRTDKAEKKPSAEQRSVA